MADQNLTPLLKELYMLRNLSDAEIAQVASSATMIPLDKNATINLPDDKDTPFYVLLSGRLAYAEITGENMRSKPVTVRIGDFFGADYLLFSANRTIEVAALENCRLLRIPTASLSALITQIPAFKTGLLDTLKLRRTLRQKAFSWIQDTEHVKLLAIKHPAVLVEFLFWPVVWLLAGVVLLLLGSQVVIASLRIAFVSFGILIAAIGAAGIIWQVIDWANDYYIITDQRVVWVERVFGLYESRREALLSAIKSTEVRTSQIGRILGYGNITVFALMGQVPIRHVPAPDQIKVIIERLQKAANMRLQQEDTQAMEKVIRRKIDPPPPAPPIAVAAKPAPLKKSRARLPELSEYFNLAERVVKDDTIIYRKHRVILILMIGPPLLALLGLLGGTGWLLYQNLFGGLLFPSTLTTILVSVVLAGSVLFWLWYQFMDWHEDVYILTADKIVDSAKKPLSTEVTKSAPLGNIQNMDYERIGLLGLLLNLGNVTINTGSDSKMDFLQVHDPAGVQLDIFNRMFALKRKQQTAEASRQWEQVSDWLAAYHRQAEDLRRSQKKD